MYVSFVFLPGAILKLAKSDKAKLVDRKFVRRLQLAVTEVNGCAACSFQHTQMALQDGMSNDEISSFLSGAGDYTKPEEAKAIMFAQHFADSRGLVEKSAYETIEKEYGINEASIILSSVQMMMAGNIYGIPFSAFLSRLQGKPYRKSSLFYELRMIVMGFVFLPLAVIHASFRSLFGLENKRFVK
ncbi:MAG: carboxymuconolactone decarboxylase family protein [Elusimicrobia bacterium]|nr:carboxymuconolactone decarboxylase family protein [Elusimicrobiota bacterium]